MTWTPFKIYKYIGQHDKICNVQFNVGSDSYLKYGRDITGEFQFRQTDRMRFEDMIQNQLTEDAPGMVRFLQRIEGQPKQNLWDLKYEGFLSTDITEIICSPSGTNQFLSNETRSFPPPTIVKFSSKDVDVAQLWANTFRRQRERGEVFTPDEQDKELAYIALTNEGVFPTDIDETRYKDVINGRIKDKIRYVMLSYLVESGKASEEEKQEFSEVFQRIIQERLNIIEAEAARAHQDKHFWATSYSKLYLLLVTAESIYEPDKLLFSAPPVWWSFERFAHIYMGHVRETKSGDYNADNTEFQYELLEVRKVIEAVLKELSEEIEYHFREQPNKVFNRSGGMAHYYNGDYYSLRIATSGLLMMFHKLKGQMPTEVTL